MIDAAELQGGQWALDVGCGCGGTTFSAAQRVRPGGKVVGIDISSPMLDRAKAQSRGDACIEFICADAATHSFDVQFDALISRHGLMFFEDPAAALRHLRHQLKTQAKMAFVAWRALADNEWLSVPLRVVQDALGVQPERAQQLGPSPFAFSNRAYVQDVLAQAGYTSIDIRSLEAPVRLSENGVEEE